MLQEADPLRQIIRYEEQLKATSQRIELLLLEDNPVNLPALRDLIGEEEQLVKYLEVESSKLSPESKAIYGRNMTRFKRKMKEHRDFIATNHGNSFLPVSQQAAFLQHQSQNAMLAQNKLTMYQNQRVQEDLGRELHGQGQKLYGGIQHNRDIRDHADEAEGAIHLIQMSILKRKIMFCSLIGLFVAAVVLVLIVKASRK